MAVMMSDEELNSLTSAILRRYGIDFTGYEPQSFKRRVNHAINYFGYDSIHELWIRLLKDRDFIQPFIDQITVGLTSMFRDPRLWSTLKSELKPKSDELEHLRIWHAGCSTGEEVYTMSIVLRESEIQDKCKSLATDINQNSLETAQRGIYHGKKAIEYQANYKKYNSFGKLEWYFEEDQNGIAMDKYLLSQVDFKIHNLITEDMKQKFDIIFCRNVMIYFDTPSKINLLNKFHSQLNENGLLITGFYDSIASIINPAQFKYHDRSLRMYRKVS